MSVITQVITHDRCVDGFISEVILRALYPGASFRRLSYGAEHDALEPVPGMLFCDMSPPRRRWEDFARAGAIVLDHHVSARGYFERPDVPALSVYTESDGISGAGLALGHGEQIGAWHMGDAGIRQLAEVAFLVGVYDTWQEKDKYFEKGCAVHALCDLLRETGGEAMPARDLAAYVHDNIAVGHRLHERNLVRAEEATSEAIRTVYRTSDGDIRVALFDGGYGTAVLNMIPRFATDCDLLVFARFDKPRPAEPPMLMREPRVRVSLRARGSLVDCASIAAKHNGGGHVGAAGFEIASDSALRPAEFAHAALMDAISGPPRELDE